MAIAGLFDGDFWRKKLVTFVGDQECFVVHILEN